MDIVVGQSIYYHLVVVFLRNTAICRHIVIQQTLLRQMTNALKSPMPKTKHTRLYTQPYAWLLLVTRKNSMRMQRPITCLSSCYDCIKQ